MPTKIPAVLGVHPILYTVFRCLIINHFSIECPSYDSGSAGFKTADDFECIPNEHTQRYCKYKHSVHTQICLHRVCITS